RAVRARRCAPRYSGGGRHPGDRARRLRPPQGRDQGGTDDRHRQDPHVRVRAGACATIALMATEVVEVEGHIIDSLILAKVLDTIVDAGADYRMVDVEIGRASTDTSRARIEVDAENEALLATLLTELQLHGANKVEDADASLEACG